MKPVKYTFDSASSPPRGRRRSRDSHKAILAAAESEVAARGYAAATIEAIAARAGVGKMTIYRWWPTKADLFAEVYDALVSPEKLVTDRGSLHEDMHHVFGTLFKIYRHTVAPAVLAGLISDAQHNEDARRNLEGGIAIGRRSLLTAPFERARKRGEIGKEVDIDFLVDLIVGAIWCRILVKTKRFDKKFLQELCNMIVTQGSQL